VRVDLEATGTLTEQQSSIFQYSEFFKLSRLPIDM
jgi:hypothetical protein